MFFQGWSDILRTIVVGSLGYAALVLSLRVSGKRTLAQLNIFDLVVTIALGSTLASVFLSSTVSLAQGITAFLTLILLQLVVAWTSVRSRHFAKIVRSEPALLVHDGRIIESALRRNRVTESELRAVLRNNKRPELSQIRAVILESDGTFSVLSGVGEKVRFAERDIDGL